MKRILYATIFLFYLNVLQSLDIRNIKNRGLKRRGNFLDVSEDVIRSKHQWYKRPSRLSNRRRDDDKSASSSIEKMKYQDEFREFYKQKKEEAFDAEPPDSDVVNMVAARPWGVPCGDPDQYDMPWGNCMRPEQCAPEYRVHRGDYFCGRTTFVCCALKFYDYDPFGPLDASFGDSDFDVPLAEKLADKKKGKRYRNRSDRRAREEERKKRKKRMKRIIDRIVRLVQKTFRNESKVRREKTRQFKKFLKRLKRKYDKSRLLVKDRHRELMNKTDKENEDRVKEIYEFNKQFIRNMTVWVRNTTKPADATEYPDYYDDDSKDKKKEPSRRMRAHRSGPAHRHKHYELYD